MEARQEENYENAWTNESPEKKAGIGIFEQKRLPFNMQSCRLMQQLLYIANTILRIQKEREEREGTKSINYLLTAATCNNQKEKKRKKKRKKEIGYWVSLHSSFKLCLHIGIFRQWLFLLISYTPGNFHHMQS